MNTELAFLMFPILLTLLFIGFPVAFSLIGVSLVFGLVQFGSAIPSFLVAKIDEIASNYLLGAVPLFIFMGALLERSGIADRLFEAIHMWTHRLPGGIAVGTIILSIIFAASTGIVGAAEAVIGMLAIPVMMRHGYNKSLISGTICAGGSLGTVIPPSVVIILLGPVADVSVGDLFAGAILPGIALATMYIVYIVTRCLLNPSDGPRSENQQNILPIKERILFTIKVALPPFVLIFSVLGTIFMGVATPTEAAACGATGAIILSIVFKRISFEMMKAVVLQTVTITAMILTILIGGTMFSGVFSVMGGMVGIQNLVISSGLSSWGTLLILLLLTFLAGFVLDLISLLLIMVPIAIPILIGLPFHGLDPVQIKIWFSICFLITIQTSYLTPPMAPAIFYLRGVAPKEITLLHMYRGVIPFILIHIVVLGALLIYPPVALYLPSIFFQGF